MFAIDWCAVRCGLRATDAQAPSIWPRACFSLAVPVSRRQLVCASRVGLPPSGSQVRACTGSAWCGSRFVPVLVRSFALWFACLPGSLQVRACPGSLPGSLLGSCLSWFACPIFLVRSRFVPVLVRTRYGNTPCNPWCTARQVGATCPTEPYRGSPRPAMRKHPMKPMAHRTAGRGDLPYGAVARVAPTRDAETPHASGGAPHGTALGERHRPAGPNHGCPTSALEGAAPG